MSLQKIRRLVSQGEGETIEFKRKVVHPEKIIREIVAFANTKGGNLLIGVDDNGTIPGLKFADEEIFLLENAIRKWCRPWIDYEIEVIPISARKAVVCYEIRESDRKPHYILEGVSPSPPRLLQKKGKPRRRHRGRAYVRYQDKSLQASREVWQILRREKKQKDVKFTFGDKEKLLMEYLDKHQEITVSQFASLADLPHRIASQTLVLLVLANVLKVIPKEKEDAFVLKFS